MSIREGWSYKNLVHKSLSTTRCEIAISSVSYFTCGWRYHLFSTTGTRALLRLTLKILNLSYKKHVSFWNSHRRSFRRFSDESTLIDNLFSGILKPHQGKPVSLTYSTGLKKSLVRICSGCESPVWQRLLWQPWFKRWGFSLVSLLKL